MHIDNDKALEWLDKLRDGVANSNNDAERIVTQAMAAPDMVRALDIIAGGHTNKFPGAPDIMEVTPDAFRSAMWSWSQEVARTALRKAEQG